MEIAKEVDRIVLDCLNGKEEGDADLDDFYRDLVGGMDETFPKPGPISNHDQTTDNRLDDPRHTPRR